MNPLEDALRDALRRENPPADFAERVVACVRQPVPEGPAWFWQRLRLVFRAPMLRLATVGAACLLLVVGVQHQRRERAKAEAARRQVMVALRVTSEALQSVRKQVSESRSARQVIHVSPGILTASKEKL